LPLIVSGCSSSGGVPAGDVASRPALAQASQQLGQSPSLATYQFFCSNIGLGTITAVVVSHSANDAFHVTNVTGGDGTVSPGDMLLVIDYTPGDKYQNHNPGFDKNGQTTYTCASYSGRRNLYGTVTFVVRGARSR
jgi:hypothetical protein